MKLTDGEKVMLLMLTEIYEKLGISGEIEPAFIRSAIFTDNTWGLSWKYSGIPFADNSTPSAVSEVVDVLDMWSFIEDSYGRLSPPEKATVEKGAKPFGKNPKFAGFDGNNEAELINIANFLIDDLGRFPNFKGRSLNSHSPSMEPYKRMMRVFAPIREKLMGNLLTAAQLTEILKERIHPESR